MKSVAPLGFAERLRRRSGALLVDGFFKGMANVGRLHPRARPERHRVTVESDIPYLASGLPEHRLDVYRPVDAPKGQPGRPAVLYVHGGGFRILSKDTHWVMALAFARRGYVVFNISYRLAPEHPFPAAVRDCCDAYQWVARNAERYGADPSRLILAGESAGANLVTVLALATAYARPEPYAKKVFDTAVQPRAVVPACGIYEVSNPHRFKRRWPHMQEWINDRLLEVSESYLGQASIGSEQELELANPLAVLERGDAPARPLPPFFIPCGTKDPLVADSQRLHAALGAMGVPSEAEYYEGELHAFHALVWRPNARRCWGSTYRFLDRHVGSPTSAVRPEAQDVLVG